MTGGCRASAAPCAIARRIAMSVGRRTHPRPGLVDAAAMQGVHGGGRPSSRSGSRSAGRRGASSTMPARRAAVSRGAAGPLGPFAPAGVRPRARHGGSAAPAQLVQRQQSSKTSSMGGALGDDLLVGPAGGQLTLALAVAGASLRARSPCTRPPSPRSMSSTGCSRARTSRAARVAARFEQRAPGDACERCDVNTAGRAARRAAQAP